MKARRRRKNFEVKNVPRKTYRTKNLVFYDGISPLQWDANQDFNFIRPNGISHGNLYQQLEITKRNLPCPILESIEHNYHLEIEVGHQYEIRKQKFLQDW